MKVILKPKANPLYLLVPEGCQKKGTAAIQLPNGSLEMELADGIDESPFFESILATVGDEGFFHKSSTAKAQYGPAEQFHVYDENGRVRRWVHVI